MKFSALQWFLMTALFSLMFTSIWSYTAFSNIERENDRILAEAIPISNTASQLFPLLLDQELTVRSYYLERRQQDFEQFQTTRVNLQASLEALEQLDDRDPTMRRILQKEAVPLLQQTDAFYQRQLMYIQQDNLIEAERNRYDGMAYINQFRPIDIKIRAEIEQIVMSATNRSKAASSSAKWVIVIVLSVAVLILFAFLQTFRLERSKRALIRRSLHDSLTGIPNRRAFDEHLERVFEEARLSASEVTLILLDVDAFKLYNDTYGHLQGDACLKQVASVLKKQAGPFGHVARYGGEEFAVVLSGQSAQGELVAERIRTGILDLKLPHERYTPLCQVSVSLGMATVQPDDTLTEIHLIDRADMALYAAKAAGKNQLVRHDAS
ncbi:GGDEF domain-containing protein [Exiguobacterium oxidotolerans]|uniref:GGDEF domain-containing protein n=1 Tax=Exiguobacterium oxidotolerans TaxID=223958 RepID=UPI000494C85E|nr:GGDEF domain-containing protein [Exiguobacterium oxidotolerans]